MLDFEQVVKEYGLEVDNKYQDVNYRWLCWETESESWVVRELVDYVDVVLYDGANVREALSVLVEGIKNGANNNEKGLVVNND